jgi:D-alanyl-D-alanine carboxypeptidase
MLRRLFALLLLAGCATTTTQPPLAQKIDALTAKLGHSLWGIDVEDEDGHRLYARNATQLFIPASNRKLFSGATAAN